MFAEPEFKDEVVHLAGDTISYQDLADLVERELGRPIVRELLSIDDLNAELIEVPDDTMRRYRAVFAIGRGMWWDKDKTFNARREIDVTDAAGWLRSHLAAAPASSIIRIDENARMSQAAVHAGIVYLSGQVGTPEASVQEQAEQVLAKIDELLERTGSDRHHLLRATILLADMADYEALNRIWDDWVASVGKPVRATYGVGPAAPRHAVEIIVTAAIRTP